MRNQLYIVDVFAEKQYAGNPLAVVVCHSEIYSNTMHLIAAEMNFSETTFLNPYQSKQGAFDVRLFTPSKELDFAGHPILGTAFVIQKHILQEPQNAVQLKLRKDTVTVEFKREDHSEVVWFDAPPIELGKVINAEDAFSSFGVELKDIDTSLPIQQASAGTAAIIVPLRSLAALQKARLNLDEYQHFLREGFPPLVYLFTSETRNQNNDFSVRFFFDAHGVREDPATGNGAAFFGEYLLKYKNDCSDRLIRIEQGFELNRPSLILLQASTMNGSNAIKIGGGVIPVAQGYLT